MKKLLWILVFTIGRIFAQDTDNTITNNINSNIRNVTVPGAITNYIQANMFQELVDSKLSIVTYYTASGTNSYSVTIPRILNQYYHGHTFKIEFTNGNTASSTLSVNGMTPVLLTTDGSTAIPSGYIKAGQMYWCYYNGSAFQLQGAAGGISLTALSANSPLSYNSVTGNFSFPSWPSNANGVLTNTGGVLSWSTPVSQFQLLTDGPGSFTSNGLSFTRVNTGATALEYRTPSQVLSDISGVPTSRTLTINGTTFDLTADRTWTISGVTNLASLTDANIVTPTNNQFLQYQTSDNKWHNHTLVAGDIPTLNQNTTGSAGSVSNSITFNNSGTGAASGSTFNGSSAQTISYNTIGALPLAGANLTTDFLLSAGITHTINLIGGNSGGGVLIKGGTGGGLAQLLDENNTTGFNTASGEALMFNTTESIDMPSSGARITVTGSAVGFQGFVYAADYSANYVAQSLTDKNYNDTHFKGLTFSNSPLTNQVANYNGTNWTFSSVTNAMIANSTIDLTAKVTGILPVANGGTGTTTPGIVAGSNITVSGTWPNQTISASGATTPWSLASGGTLTGVNTITSNSPSQLIFTGTQTATANNQNQIQFTGTFTSENVAGDNLNGMVINPTLTRNAGNPTGQTATALFINPTFSNIFTNQYLIRAQSGGVDKFNVTDGGNLSTVGTISATGSITSAGALTLSGSGSITIGTGSALIGSVSNNAKLYVSQQALSSSQTPAFRVDVGAHTAIATTIEYNLSKITAATLTWTDGTVSVERVNFDDAITLNGTTTLATFSDAYGRFTAKPLAGAKGAITRPWGLGTDGNLQVQGSAFFGAATTAPTAFIHSAGSTTSAASLRIGSGTAPSSPNQGDIWNDGTNLFFYSSSQKNAVASNFSIAAPATTGTMTTTLTNVSAVTITPTGSCTFNASGGIAGADCTFVITTSGTSAFTMTWGTNFKSTGTLSTGTVTAKVFTVSFRYDGTNWNETARTTAM